MTQAKGTDSQSGEQAAGKRKHRTWPVTAVGLLLLLQAIGLFTLGLLHFGIAYLGRMGLLGHTLEQSIEQQFLSLLPGPARVWIRASFGAVNEELLSRMSESNFTSLGVLFIALSAVAILAAISLLRLQRDAWIWAMLTQGLTLLVALLLYFSGRPWYTYILMFHSSLMVLYLNYHEVRGIFQPKPASIRRVVKTHTGGRKGDT